jgi:hypothetical protein
MLELEAMDATLKLPHLAAYAFISGLSSVPSTWPAVSRESPQMKRREIPIPAVILRLASKASHSVVLLAHPSHGKAS